MSVWRIILIGILAAPLFGQEPLQPLRSFVRPTACVQLANWEHQIVAACLVLEAADQGKAGMAGVMAVIKNRAGRPEKFAATVLRPKQFSALNRHTSGQETSWQMVRRAQRDAMWSMAESIVQSACRDDWVDPTGGATHYTRRSERPWWSRNMTAVALIGDHRFYR